VYRVLTVVWVCVQSVSYCMDCVQVVSYCMDSVQVVSCCVDVCTECQLLYGCVYRVSAIVWMCVQSVIYCMDCVQVVSYCLDSVQVVSCSWDVCTECQLLYGCVYMVSTVVWICVQCVSYCMDVCTECQLLYR